VASVDTVQCEDGTVGKQGLSTTIINVHGQMRLDMQRQELKTKEWDIIRQAKDAGVPGINEVAASFVKQHFAYLLDTNKLKKMFIPCFSTVYVCDKAECVGMPTYNPLHCHGECYSCCSVFCYEHITKSKKSVLGLTCMVEYCDNLLCGKCTVSEEKRSGRVGSYCFACEKHMWNQFFF
jgi:hypothetical protein